MSEKTELLNKREAYLVYQSYIQGYEQSHNDTVEGGYTDARECCHDWLADMAGDGITVEMELDKDAGTRHLPPTVEAVLEAARELNDNQYCYAAAVDGLSRLELNLTDAIRNHDKETGE